MSKEVGAAWARGEIHRTVVRSLLGCLGVTRVLRCAVDGPLLQHVELSLGQVRVDECNVELLGASLENAPQPYDGLWLAGHVSWHALYALNDVLTKALDARRAQAGRPLILLI